MGRHKQLDIESTGENVENEVWFPQSFAEVVDQVKSFVLEEFDREITQNQLYYHNHEHISHVLRRAKAIFRVVAPYWQTPDGQKADDLERMHLLLELCAVAHDMVQVFIPQHQPHTSRQRSSGESENLTWEKLSNYLQALNQQLKKNSFDDSLLFQDADISIIRETIQATVCVYDPCDRSIYQPDIYDKNKDLSLVTRIIALVDINSLGIDGIDIYNREGTLIFLEENPDVIPIILDKLNHTLDKNSATENSEISENIRQRLLKRARFQVNFAKSRLQRYPQEISSFPQAVIPTLTKEIFSYLNPEIIQEIETTTPVDEDTSLEELIRFFKFEDLEQIKIQDKR
ncbi:MULTISPECIES: hypothetical protein [unclassified Tolypothrix]|uniref:hypothetical protein n=1 Tax=unclassified Tolypothrix TaxID=2649714 RepID=UPI001D13410E|nr:MULTISPECIES: hypothetical protein [unclassified Tolypothrix]